MTSLLRRVGAHLGITIFGAAAFFGFSRLAVFFYGWHAPCLVGMVGFGVTATATICCIPGVFFSNIALAKKLRSAPAHSDDGDSVDRSASAANTSTAHPPRSVPAAPTLTHYAIDWDALAARHPPDRVAAMRRLAIAWKPFEKQMRQSKKIPDDPLFILEALSKGGARLARVTHQCPNGMPFTTSLHAGAHWTTMETIARPLLNHPATAPAARTLLELFVCDEEMARLVWVDIAVVLGALAVWTDRGDAPSVAQKVSEGLSQRARALLATTAPVPSLETVDRFDAALPVAEVAPSRAPSDAPRSSVTVASETTPDGVLPPRVGRLAV